MLRTRLLSRRVLSSRRSEGLPKAPLAVDLSAQKRLLQLSNDPDAQDQVMEYWIKRVTHAYGEFYHGHQKLRKNSEYGPVSAHDPDFPEPGTFKADKPEGMKLTEAFEDPVKESDPKWGLGIEIDEKSIEAERSDSYPSRREIADFKKGRERALAFNALRSSKRVGDVKKDRPDNSYRRHPTPEKFEEHLRSNRKFILNNLKNPFNDPKSKLMLVSRVMELGMKQMMEVELPKKKEVPTTAAEKANVQKMLRKLFSGVTEEFYQDELATAPKDIQKAFKSFRDFANTETIDPNSDPEPAPLVDDATLAKIQKFSSAFNLREMEQLQIDRKMHEMEIERFRKAREDSMSFNPMEALVPRDQRVSSMEIPTDFFDPDVRVYGFPQIDHREESLNPFLAVPSGRPVKSTLTRRYTYNPPNFKRGVPCERKVVVQVHLEDIPLKGYPLDCFLEIVGPRYNAAKKVVTITCECFPSPDENEAEAYRIVRNTLNAAEDMALRFPELPE